MIITAFSDPHLGLTRTSHTTPTSRAKLRQELYKQAERVFEEPGHKLCLGDVFDTFSVDNQTLLHGHKLLAYCNIVLAGNHDYSNRSDALSTLSVLRELRSDEHRPGPTEPRAYSFTAVDAKFWCVDHKMTQSIFEEALDHAYRSASKNAVLLLHCNYDSPFATQESTLNLTKEKARGLLDKFSHILIGHEHTARTDIDGRVILLGNTHPTSFSDLSDKFYWRLQFDRGVMVQASRVKIWDKDTGSISVNWADLPDLNRIGPSVQFIDITGEAEAEHMPTIAKQVASLWSMSDNLLMVRNSVTTTGVSRIETQDETRCMSIPDLISSELEGTRLEPLWKEYLSKL